MNRLQTCTYAMPNNKSSITYYNTSPQIYDALLWSIESSLIKKQKCKYSIINHINPERNIILDSPQSKACKTLKVLKINLENQTN